MKIAYLILGHKNADQINYLIENLRSDNADVFVHLDKKSNLHAEIMSHDNVTIIPKEESFDITWGSCNMTRATMLLMKYVFLSKVNYDYLWLISGQDFPIASREVTLNFLEEKKGTNFIEVFDENSDNHKRYRKRNELKYPRWICKNNFFIKVIKKMIIIASGGNYNTFIKRKNITDLNFRFGSQWWTLTFDAALFIYNYLNENKKIFNFFDNSIIPDECIIQSVFMQSPYADLIDDKLCYVDWKNCKRSPKTLTVKDWDALFQSKHNLMARKFDWSIDKEIVMRLSKLN